MPSAVPEADDDPTRVIAVIGMAGRFPGAPDVDSFWRLLADGREAIRPVPGERWDSGIRLDPELEIQRAGGFIDDVALFDATFFGISPREAEVMDPQQRLMLETAWCALEDSGTPVASIRGTRTGVYIGALWHDYEILRKERGVPVTPHSLAGCELDMIAARVSYFLGLTGPSFVVTSGCSSSLVALHVARQALILGEVDAALAGGVNLILTPDASVGLTHLGALSPTGRCHAFSGSADGYVRAEGVGAVHLKTLDRAIRDGDRVRGLIVWTEVNNDGGGESAFTPNPVAQEDLLRRAYTASGVPIDQVAYVEAHGTGTSRGDPIEASAIGLVLGRSRRRGLAPLPIGSVKTNTGHLEAAAAMPGVFKALLSLEHGYVPASLPTGQPNPAIPFEELNLRFAHDRIQLPARGPVYLGVNSFGLGGTNAHVILTRAPSSHDGGKAAREVSGLPVLLPFSAHTSAALRQRAGDLAEFVERTHADVEALASTLVHRRDHLGLRAAMVVSDRDSLLSALQRYADDSEPDTDAIETGRAVDHRGIAFVFPGQGSQWAGMAKQLMGVARFREVIDKCAGSLAPFYPWDLRSVLSGDLAEGWLDRIEMVQPALWATMVALAEMWRAVGIEPGVVVGHSQGEIAAATIAGALSYDDAARVVASRSAIARRTVGHGRMLAVELSRPDALSALAGFEDSVHLAAHNGPSSCVLTGRTDAVLLLKEILEDSGTFCRLVNVDYASHSPQMEELRADLMQVLDPVGARETTIPMYSTVDGRLVCGPDLDARYWVDNLCRPVRFADVMADVLVNSSVTHCIEISPHPVLTPDIEQLAAHHDLDSTVLTTLYRGAATPTDLVRAFGRAYVSGLTPFGFFDRTSNMPIPHYPWQRRRHWVGPARRPLESSLAQTLVLIPDVVEQDVLQGRIELNLVAQPWLRDHRVGDAIVYPGVASLALLVQAAVERTGAPPAELDSIVFHAGLTLTEEPTQLALTWREDVTGGASCALHSLAANESSWLEHATGRVWFEPREEVAAPFPELVLAASQRPAEEHYATSTARGLRYGPSFQGIRRLFRTGAEALAEVVLPGNCRASAERIHPHVALWDACLQTGLALYPGTRTLVPVGVERVVFLRRPDEPITKAWAHAVRRAEFCDVLVFDSERRPVLAMYGIRLQELISPDPDPSTRTLDFRFEEAAAAAPPRSAQPCVLCGPSEAAAAIARLSTALLGMGAPVETIVVADDDPLPDLTAALRSASGTELVFVATPPELGVHRYRQGLWALTTVVRACLRLAAPPRLVVVTQRAHYGADGDIPDPGSAMFWGFTRVLQNEHPELRPRLLDVASADDYPEVAREIHRADSDDQLLVRNGRRLVGRLRYGAGSRLELPAVAWQTPPTPFRLEVTRPGYWDGAEYRSMPRRAPGPGEIEIEVAAAGLNFVDVMKVMGTYPDRSRTGLLLGGECAGRVTRVGPDSGELAPGDRVVAVTMGALGSHVVAPAAHAWKLADTMADEDAATVSIAMITAWYGLCDLARLRKGETVLIHSAAGGVGLAAVQIASLIGAQVIATAGSPEKREYLHASGIAHVLDSRELSWGAELYEITGGRGVDVVLNSLTGAAIPMGLEALAEDGRFIEIGKRDIYAGRRIALAPFRKGIGLAAVDLDGMMQRRPKLFARLMRTVWQYLTEGALEPIPWRRYSFDEIGDAVRMLGSGQHLGKIVLTDPGAVRGVAPKPRDGNRFHADATYLITGGLGALGLSLADFLITHGAGTIVLLGRSRPAGEVPQRIAAMRGRGARIECRTADVADEDAMRCAIEEIRAELPPLRGVFHLAGMLEDATIGNLVPEQIERAAAPKAAGCVILDRCTRGVPLDLFVLFSSAVVLVGNPGQAAYAAANAYLDAFAVARRLRGLPALSVRWGAFDAIGLAAAASNRGDRLADRGIQGFDADQAWTALLRMVDTDRPLDGYAPFDVRRWFDAYPFCAAVPAWQQLRQSGADEGAAASPTSEFRNRLLAVAPPERIALALHRVRELTAQVLRLDIELIENETPLKSAGLDSLMALELRNRMEATFGLRLSSTFLWTFAVPRSIAAELCDRVSAEATASAARPW
ncbi:type I polyketide synthase [Nocardia sp. NPDC050710]|uniref:type I polyketide synthase n=1 Tax=Nocardia sp. NPDC050710 TaxID=3157220 RepID=UPI003406801B